MAADERGREVDVEELLRQLATRRAERYGRLDEQLAERLRTGRDDDDVRVASWLRVDKDAFDERARLELRGDEREMPPHARRQREATSAATRAFARQLERVRAREVRPDRLAPVVYAVVPARAVRQLAEQEQVAGIFLYDPEGVDDLDEAMDVASSGTVHGLGFTGSAVRVAVWEQGPDSTANLDIEDSFDASPSTSQHSRHVHGTSRTHRAANPTDTPPTACCTPPTPTTSLRWSGRSRMPTAG